MQEAKQCVEFYKSVFEEQLLNYLNKYSCDVPQIFNAIKYGIVDGGKRIRPILAYLGAKFCGKEPEYVTNIALGVEMIHSYSLIHDDLPCMDNDVLRRGKLTVHKKFGEDVGVLAGDGLLTLAFECLAEDKENSCTMLAAIKYIAKMSGINGMVGGQTLDIENNSAVYFTLEDVATINNKKTACLLKAALIGSLIKCGASHDEIVLFEKFGDIFGEIFQLVDDILDKTSNSETMGKTVHKDEKSGKLTYVERVGLDQAKKRTKILESQGLTILKSLGDRTQELQNFTKYLTNRII